MSVSNSYYLFKEWPLFSCWTVAIHLKMNKQERIEWPYMSRLNEWLQSKTLFASIPIYVHARNKYDKQKRRAKQWSDCDVTLWLLLHFKIDIGKVIMHCNISFRAKELRIWNICFNTWQTNDQSHDCNNSSHVICFIIWLKLCIVSNDVPTIWRSLESDIARKRSDLVMRLKLTNDNTAFALVI